MCLRCLYVPKDRAHEDKSSVVLPRNMLKKLESYGSIKQGSGPKGQDTFTIMPNFAQNTHFFAVYDGAGPRGYEVAQKAESVMREYLERSEKRLLTMKRDEDCQKFLREGFKSVQEALEAMKLDYQHTKSGSCCTSILICGNTAHVANIGNCRTVLCTSKKDGSNRSIDLSQDHTLDNLKERERCIRAGSKLSAAPPSAKTQVLGPERIWYNEEGPGTIVTRMLGSNKNGVIPDPDFSSFEIQLSDKFIVLGSDGIWDVLKSREVCDMIDLIPNKKNASEEIVSRARKLWETSFGDQEYRFVGDDVSLKSPDDIAVVIVYLNHATNF